MRVLASQTRQLLVVSNAGSFSVVTRRHGQALPYHGLCDLEGDASLTFSTLEHRMREVGVSQEEVLVGFDRLADMYGHVPPLIMWRAWELAAYCKYRLPEPVLDVGCGDGRFFRRVFPDIDVVVGVDLSETAVEAARRSGVYSAVQLHSGAPVATAGRGLLVRIRKLCARTHGPTGRGLG